MQHDKLIYVVDSYFTAYDLSVDYSQNSFIFYPSQIPFRGSFRGGESSYKAEVNNKIRKNYGIN